MLIASLIAASLQQASTPLPVNITLLDPPCASPSATFGDSVSMLDFDGDGFQDIAVGASGEGTIYIYLGTGAPTPSRFKGPRIFGPSGPLQCPITPASGGFGFDVWGAELDGDPADELIVGAPSETVGGVPYVGAAYLIGYGANPSTPVRLASPDPGAGRFGSAVVAGDFNADGQVDVAVSARLANVAGVDAGRVYVWLGPIDPADAPLVLDNPHPVPNGNLGHHMAVGDSNGDGLDDLVVNAIGNDSAGVTFGGQVFVYEAPIGALPNRTISDPAPNAMDLPGPRYGMHIDARGPWVTVGANRKDHSGIHDAGRGFTQSGPTFQDIVLHDHLTAKESDYFAFRCAIADVVGDDALDFTFIVMPLKSLPEPNLQQLYIWDGNDRAGEPALIRQVLLGSGDHYGNGLDRGQLLAGGKEELILGDPTYDRPGMGVVDNVGRVVVYSF